MKRINLKVKNEQGLHARPSTKFVQITQKYEGDIKVIFNDEEVDAKNVMGLMLLAISKNDEFTVVANLDNEISEKEVLDELKYLVEVLKFNEI
ncbi:HPr family phosphocarrier protein [Oceanivirga salmonicida]|uniref:HPr family phosphocarrier protein n=1 Tax=Oceanivirga salmonicida TaxID=1769291 RepID=UPI0008337CFF|nr:HPr family phosphocarrier protein [Oceanivirga salmonicida]